jgi:DNA-binding XRE family transcriptional regulator
MTPMELRLWREHWFLDQGKLARLLGVHINSINNWECGRRAIPPFLPLALETLARGLAQQLQERAAAGLAQHAFEDLGAARAPRRRMPGPDGA